MPRNQEDIFQFRDFGKLSFRYPLDSDPMLMSEAGQYYNKKHASVQVELFGIWVNCMGVVPEPLGGLLVCSASWSIRLSTLVR